MEPAVVNREIYITDVTIRKQWFDTNGKLKLDDKGGPLYKHQTLEIFSSVHTLEAFNKNKDYVLRILRGQKGEFAADWEVCDFKHIRKVDAL